MSRVRKPGNKYGNDIKHTPEEVGPGPVIRSKLEKVDPTKATTLSSWLFLKYDMSYKTYRNKSKAARDALRAEYLHETESHRQAISQKYACTCEVFPSRDLFNVYLARGNIHPYSRRSFTKFFRKENRTNHFVKVIFAAN